MWPKVKDFLADDAIFTSLLILLIGTASFGLGRLSVEEGSVKAKPQAEETVATVTEANKFASTTGAVMYVGSKNSDKYHLQWCSGAKRISEANKVFFKSKEEAEAVGYKPAANCPGI